MLLKRVVARAIKDSRGENTLEVQISDVRASAPAGKSTGKYETPSYRESLEWNTKFLNDLEFNLEIKSFNDLKKIESLIKKNTKLKDVKKFGANALVALEVAVLKALAKEQNKKLWQVINEKAKIFPIPVGNAVGGGLHSHNKDAPKFQEFLLIPKSSSPKDNFAIMKKTHARLKSLVKSPGMNDEGAWETSLLEEQVLEILSKFPEVRLGVDVAASSFFHDNQYCYKDKCLISDWQSSFINNLITKYNLFYVEDPLHEEDFNGFSKIIHSDNHLVVGDDLTATHISRLKKSLKSNSINAMIVKPNQNGSLLEVREIIEFCKKNNVKTILSHRSGETMDSALADLAFGFQTDFIKCGIATPWRETKLKRLCEIENEVI